VPESAEADGMFFLPTIGECVVAVLSVFQEARPVAKMIPDDGMILGVERNPGVATTPGVAVAVLVPVQALLLSALATMLVAALVVAFAAAVGPGMEESRSAMADLLAADEFATRQTVRVSKLHALDHFCFVQCCAARCASNGVGTPDCKVLS